MDDKLNTAYATVSRAKAIAEEVVAESGGGTAVEANPPEMIGDEEVLRGIKIGDNSYIVNLPYVVGEVSPGEEEGEFEVQMHISPLVLDRIASEGFPCALDYDGIVLVPFVAKADTSSWEFITGIPIAEENKIYTYRFLVGYDFDTEEWSVEGSVGEMNIGGGSGGNILTLDYDSNAYVFEGTKQDLLDPTKDNLIILNSPISGLSNRQLHRNGAISDENGDGASYSCTFIEGSNIYIAQVDILAYLHSFGISVSKELIATISE